MPEFLLPRRMRDPLGDALRHAVHALQHLRHGRAGLACELGAAVDASHGGADQLLDLLGRLGAALREEANLRGHDGEPAPFGAGAGGFHRGVQREQVRLESDRVHDVRDVRDLPRRRLDVGQGGRDLVYQLVGFAHDA